MALASGVQFPGAVGPAGALLVADSGVGMKGIEGGNSTSRGNPAENASGIYAVRRV